MVTDVYVPFVVHCALFLDSLEGIIVALPDGTTDFLISVFSAARSQDVHLGWGMREREHNVPIHASHVHMRFFLSLGPLLKTKLVNIVPARSSAPHNLFLLKLEFCEADWAVTEDFFALAAAALIARGIGIFGDRSIGKNPL